MTAGTIATRDQINDYIRKLGNDDYGAGAFLHKRFYSVKLLETKQAVIVGGAATVGLCVGMFVAGIPVLKWLYPLGGIAIGAAGAFYYREVMTGNLMEILLNHTRNVMDSQYVEAGYDPNMRTPPKTTEPLKPPASRFTTTDKSADYVGFTWIGNDYAGLALFLQKRLYSIKALQAKTMSYVGVGSLIGLGIGALLSGVSAVKWVLPALVAVAGGIGGVIYSHSYDELAKRLLEPREDIKEEEYAAVGYKRPKEIPPINTRF